MENTLESVLDEQLLEQAVQDGQMLNSVYKEISEKLGIDAAVELHRLFKGQQISFPVRLLEPEKVQNRITQEYDGTNIRDLANRYGYSEKSIRRILHNRKR